MMTAPATTRRAPIVAPLLVVSVLWGSAWIPNQILAEQISPYAVGTFSFGIAALACAIANLVASLRVDTDRSHKPLPRTLLPVAAMLGVTMFAAPYLLLLWAGQHGVSVWIPLGYAMLPLAFAVMEGRPLAPTVLAVGAVLGLLNGSLSTRPGILVWTVPILAAVTLQGWSLSVVRRTLPHSAAAAAMAMQFACAGLVLFLVGWLSGNRAPSPLPTQWPLILAALALGLGTNAGAYLLYYRVLGRCGLTQAATTQWLQPLIALCESAGQLRLLPSWTMLAVAAVLVGCVWHVLGSVAPETVALELAGRD